MILTTLYAVANNAHHTAEAGMTTEHWVVLSNVLLILVTAATALLMAREQHAHSIERAKIDSGEKKDLTQLVHEVIQAEHEEEMARLHNDDDEPEATTEGDKS